MTRYATALALGVLFAAVVTLAGYAVLDGISCLSAGHSVVYCKFWGFMWR